jgi:hypothetical protein
MFLPLFHPAIDRVPIEAHPPAVPDERQLQAVDAVIDRMTGRAEVLRGRVHVEPARFDV